MDIAEIRKKARENKHKSADTIQSAPTLSSPSNKLISVDQPQRVEQLEHVGSAVSSIPVQEQPSSTASAGVDSNDGLDRLFGWNPETESLSAQGFDSKFNALQEKAEADCRRWLAFMLGDEEYALDIVNIREIIKPREITDIPRVPAFLLGIISLRGNIIPVFDLKKRLRLGEAELSTESRIVVCQYGDRFAGLLVDRISQVVSLPESNIEPPPAVLTGIDRDLVAGVGRLQGKMMILPHLSSVLNVELA